MRRRLFVATSMAAALAGCDSWKNALNNSAGVRRVVDSAEDLDHAVIGTRGMAKLYAERDLTRDFPVNGLDTPTYDPAYAGLSSRAFAGYRLPVTGEVEQPQTFTLAQLRALPRISQITRHDCVEGWSVIGKWAGVPTATLLDLVRPKPSARYMMCYSYDKDDQGTPFYGSIDLHQARHPQTQLALEFDGRPVPAQYGGPVRLRIPTQLAYKSTKWIRQIEFVSSFAGIRGGHGGYWEDGGYAWYAGI